MLIEEIVIEHIRSQINDKVLEQQEYDRKNQLSNAIENLEIHKRYQEYHSTFDKLLEMHKLC